LNKPDSPHQQQWIRPILIVGAGVTGLILARALTKAQIPCTLLEAKIPESRLSTKIAVVDGALKTFKASLLPGALESLLT
jgi:2-polyprenyl-6-methoxyphenol hydroxylase-like FAD-dependent oxidoreductase